MNNEQKRAENKEFLKWYSSKWTKRFRELNKAGIIVAICGNIVIWTAAGATVGVAMAWTGGAMSIPFLASICYYKYKKRQRRKRAKEAQIIGSVRIPDQML